MLKCTFCGRRAAYHRRYAGVLLCDRCLIKSVEKRFRRAIAEHQMISPRGRVALAVSGGKDSIALMHLLAEYCKQKNCELVAITIDEGIKGYRNRSVQMARENAESLGVEHAVVSFKLAFGATLDQMVKLAKLKKTGLNHCTYCGVMRRSLLNQAAREIGADKLATAHNLDDEVQAIMLNYVRADLSKLHRLGPTYPPQKGFVPRIKPSKFMILRMFERLKPHIARVAPKFKMRRCELCGEQTSADICKSCELLKGLGLKRLQKTLISPKSS